MCGRFSLNTDLKEIKEQFGVVPHEPLPNSFNVAPTENALCLINKEHILDVLPMRWSLIPWYPKVKKNMLLINARVETISDKDAFKQSLKSRRCIVLMSGFFEWQHHKQEKKTIKQPFYITRKDKQLMPVAAIWDYYKPDADTKLPSCCVLTTAPDALVAPLHDRMPWILSKQQQDEWLKSQALTQEDLERILTLQTPLELECHPVTPAVNSALYKEKDTVVPLNT